MRDIRPSTGEGADATAAADAGSVPTGWIWAMVRLGADPVVAGGTGTGDGAAKGSVSRFDGSTWSPIGDEGDLDGTVYAMALFGDDLVIGGAFHDAGGVPAADYVALWDGAGWVALGSDESGDGAIDGVVTALLVVEDSLFATGALISETGGDKPAVIARWDGDTWSTMPVGTETQQ